MDTFGAVPYTRLLTMRGIRGATQVAANTAEALEEAVIELCRELTARNNLEPSDIVWAIFTVTHDLNAGFPATAARKQGWNDVPMICSQEIPVPGSLPRCIRLLVHAYTTRSRAEIKHCYLRGATVLRPDRV